MVDGTVDGTEGLVAGSVGSVDSVGDVDGGGSLNVFVMVYIVPSQLMSTLYSSPSDSSVTAH